MPIEHVVRLRADVLPGQGRPDRMALIGLEEENVVGGANGYVDLGDGELNAICFFHCIVRQHCGLTVWAKCKDVSKGRTLVQHIRRERMREDAEPIAAQLAVLVIRRNEQTASRSGVPRGTGFQSRLAG